MIEAWAVSGTLILARVAAFVATQPLLGGRQAPRLVKAGLALSLSLCWIADLDPLSAWIGSPISSQTPWFGYALAVARETLIGALLGYGLGLLLLPVRTAGEFIGQELGLSLASVADPTTDSSATLVGQIFELLGIALWFGCNGHHVWLAALHATFARWPIGGAIPDVPVLPFVGGMARAQEWGLLLAAPLAACLFTGSLLLALMARAAPQLNLMSVGFALRLAIGLSAAVIFLPDLAAGISGVTAQFAAFLTSLI